MLRERTTETEPKITQGVTIVAFRPDGKILLHLRDHNTVHNPGRWSLITGRLEKGELINDCVPREFAE